MVQAGCLESPAHPCLHLLIPSADGAVARPPRPVKSPLQHFPTPERINFSPLSSHQTRGAHPSSFRGCAPHCVLWHVVVFWGEGEPRRRRGRGSPSPQAPHPLPCAHLSGRMEYEAARKPPFAHLSPGDASRQPRSNAGTTPPNSGEKETETSAFRGNAPRRSGDRRKKCPQHQRAGARRRSQQRGSAATGAHITREAGRCAPIGPLRRAADKVHDMRQRRPPPHETRGSTGVVGGVEGHAPLTPCRISAVDARKAPASPNGHGPAGRHSVARRAGDHARMSGRSRKPAEKEKRNGKRKAPPVPPRRRPRPDAGPKPQANGRKESPSRLERTYTQGKIPMQGTKLPAGQGIVWEKPPTQRAGARRRSPQRGSAAAGAHITREAGRCAPIGPLRRAADKVHDMRQRRPPPHGTRGSRGS